LRVDLARGLVDVLLFLCAFGALVATIAGASTASAIETGAAEDGPATTSVAIGAISAGPATATGTTGATSETDGSDCTSGAEVSTTGVSTAVICGIGAACTISAGANEPIPEEPIEGPTAIDAPLFLGLTAYPMTAAPTPTAKTMVSTCSNTIFYTPVSFLALSCLLMTSQRYYTIASIQRTGAQEVRPDPPQQLLYHLPSYTLTSALL
jgi:hypothetical protein